MVLINDISIRRLVMTGALALATLSSGLASGAAPDGATIIRERCLACHTEEAGASPTFSRISGQRKTPEGWHMTLNRMQHQRGQQLPADEKRTLIKYLADTQGLAPSEAAPYRYLLEQDTNRVESVAPAYTDMCMRCHSGARFALQRRSEAEWKLLVHFHMGQHPTLELHALSRDRPWMQLALDDIAPQLAKDFPLDSPAWREWQQAPRVDMAGSWRMLGYVPGKGEFEARMNAQATAPDHFKLRLEGNYMDGTPLRGEGSATLYTGYEWRAALTVDGVKMRQVMAANDKGDAMSGRFILRDAREIGGALQAWREDGQSKVVAVSPSYLRAATSATLTILGSDFGDDDGVSLGDGVKVLKVVSRSADRIVVVAEARGEAGLRDVKVGGATGTGLLAVYDRVARVELNPGDGVARIGGGENDPDAQLNKVRVAFRAIGYAAGADGKAGTDDDLRLGYMPAVWRIEPLNETAEKEQDHLYAGTIDAHGVFTPGNAGPNPARHMSANNVGMLRVVALVSDGAEQVRGQARLLVAVPDFVRRVLD
jgi:quinohemoprotein amine dehydrogenase